MAKDPKDFMSKWLEGGRVADPSKLSRHTIKSDKWDREDFENLLKAMPEFDGARDRLCDAVDTGNGMWADTFFSFFKVDPAEVPTGEIRPDYLVNQAVGSEMRGLREFEELRTLGTIGDDVNAALACQSMRPELETIYDKLQKEQELAKQIQEDMEKLRQSCTCTWHPLDWGPPQEQPPAGYVEPAPDECGDRYYYPDQPPGEGEGDPPLHQPPGGIPDPDQLGEGEGEGEGDGPGPRDFQANQELLNEQAKRLRDRINENAQKLQDGLKDKAPAVRGQLARGMQKAVDDAKAMQTSCETWGLDPGTLQRLPADQRMELAKRLNNPRLKRIAELFGPMRRLMFTEQRRKVNHAREEVYDISKGNDLSRILPIQFSKLQNPLTKLEFFREFVEGNLLQYEMRGEERVGKGGIIFCEDGSGSMSGEPELWAKAVGLCLLNLAKEQKRSFRVIHFGGPNQTWEMAFEKPEDFTLDNLLAFAEIFFGGGTDFMTPLSRALDHLQVEFNANGAVKGDIVFATDGSCGVQPSWLEDFCAERERLHFTCWGISIGGYTADEPLSTICDGKVTRISDLRDGNDMRQVFGGIGI